MSYPSFQVATNQLNKCTYATTGTSHQYQHWRHCYTCFPNPSEGACLNCVSLCHEGHALGPIMHGLFFCDCGEKHMCKQGQFKNPPSVMPPTLNTPPSVMPPKLNPSYPVMPMSSFPGQPLSSYNGPAFASPASAASTASSGTANSSLSSTVSLDKQLSTYNNNLATKLFNNMPVNRIFSPMSIAYALSLLHLGAGGTTNTEISALFGGKYTFDDLKKIYSLFNNDVVKMANSLTINDHCAVNPEYLQLLKDIVLVTKENFSNSPYVTQKLNAFIESNTNGLIKNVIDSVDQSMFAVLINTIYFKANWKHTFDKTLTHKTNFTNSSGVVQIDMMAIEKRFPYYANENMQMIEMPYVGDQYCMGVVLPKQELAGVIPSMDVTSLNQYIEKMNSYNKVNVYMPKFTHRKNIDLIQSLKASGINDLFTQNANLNNIANGIHISKAIHEAVVIVDEEGTEAAAMTVMYAEKCCYTPPTVFKADHSFIYYIRHKPTNMILFVGDYHGY